MQAFGMQNSVEGFRKESTHVSGRTSGWDVDWTNRSDFKAVGNRNNAMPAEFGSPFELYDGSQSQSPLNQFERNMQFQMQMMMQVMDRFMQYMEAMFRAQMGDPSSSGDVPSGSGGGGAGSGGDTSTGSGGSGGDSGHHCHHVDHKPVNDGGSKPGNDGGSKPGSDGGTKPGNDGGSKPGNDGGSKPGNDGGTKPGSDGGTKPGNDGGTKPGSDVPIGDHGAPKYADTGVQRGRTIYRDDFNGAKGEHPNSNVFDTQHIGPDGLTRQRGDSIHEDAIISDNNTVMDGNGHLQLFADKQKTLDPKTGEYVDYTKGSFNTGKDSATNEKGLTFNLKDYPNGLVIETRAKHPENSGTKFDALWIMTNTGPPIPLKVRRRRTRSNMMPPKVVALELQCTIRSKTPVVSPYRSSVVASART